MTAKKIATSLPSAQYVALERVRKRLRLKRSEAVQEALALWLAAREGDDRVAQYVRGYAEQPDAGEALPGRSGYFPAPPAPRR